MRHAIISGYLFWLIIMKQIKRHTFRERHNEICAHLPRGDLKKSREKVPNVKL